MKTYKIFLLALALGTFMAILYATEVIPAWLGILIGWVGGLLIYKRFA